MEDGHPPVPFAQMPGITDALRERLDAVGATEPSFMIGKSMEMSDVSRNQARLLFSCKRKSPSQSPVTAVFTQTERQFVHSTAGLIVTAFDRDGRSYNLTCKYLESNSGYRFISGWRPYVRDNNLGVAMRVELWTFRSRKLPNQYEMRQGKEGKMDKVYVMVESGHPDGSMGLVLLHYGNDQMEPEQADADEPHEANGMEPEPEQAAVDEPDEALEVQKTEMGHNIESKTTTSAEDKLADDGGECPKPTIKSRNTEISREDVYNAAKGLLKLRECLGRGSGGAGKPEI